MGKCIICEKDDTKIINDMCKNCNTALELINHDRQILKSMLNYIQKYDWTYTGYIIRDYECWLLWI